MKCPNCNKSLWLLRNFCPFCQSKLVAPPRPQAVTVIAWIIFAISAVLMLSVLFGGTERFLGRYKAHQPVMYARFFGALVIGLVTGVFMLRGANWARWLFVVWFGFNQAAKFASLKTLHPAEVVGAVLTGLAIYLLFRPGATAFFRGAAKVVLNDNTPLPEGQAVCRECGKAFQRENMVHYEDVHVCPQCKPVFLQKVREGVKAS